MRYFGSSLTDIGISRGVNQDSVFLRIENTPDRGQMALALVCDGLGGLEMGEYASSSTVEAFAKWFDDALPKAASITEDTVKEQWSNLIEKQNDALYRYGMDNDIRIGTTMTALLIVKDRYIIGHIGDSRCYEIAEGVKQLTEDHSFIAREIKEGRMTEAEALKDSRKNALLKCLGAFESVSADFYLGTVEKECCFLLCSDGLRHMLSSEELGQRFAPENIMDGAFAEVALADAVRTVKERQEKDNISAILIKSSTY